MKAVANYAVRGEAWATYSSAALLAAAMLAIFLVAPHEQTMGSPQKILYVHVSVAWFGLLGYLMTAGFGLMYLLRRGDVWDDWSRASAETGWICSTLTLATGSLWAHEAWNTWWTWDPRLTTSLILWAAYAGYFLIRGSIEDPGKRARTAAVLSLLGAVDVPLVVMATRWFRGIHPVSPSMEPTMQLVLLLTVTGFTCFFVILLIRRQTQLGLQRQVDSFGTLPS
jgi:heme exporter protein C